LNICPIVAQLTLGLGEKSGGAARASSGERADAMQMAAMILDNEANLDMVCSVS
jgi:hypothetical protein